MSEDTPCEDPYEALGRKTAEARGEPLPTTEGEHCKANHTEDAGRVVLPPTESAKVVEWRDPEPHNEAEHLLALVKLVKHTGGAVEIMGVRIEPCDGHGETVTTRRLREISQLARNREEQFGHAHEALRKARHRIAELERERFSQTERKS